MHIFNELLFITKRPFSFLKRRLKNLKRPLKFLKRRLRFLKRPFG